MRWSQKGTSRRGIPTLSCSWGGGDGTSTEGLKCLGIVSQRPSAAVAFLEFGTGWDLLSYVIPFEHFKVKEHCCLWGHSSRYHRECAVFSWTDICFCMETL